MDGDKKRLNATERESLVRLNVAYEILLRESENLKDRARAIPWAARDLGLLRYRINRLMEQFAETIPTDQLKTYVNALKMTGYTIGAKRPFGEKRNEKDYGMWLPYEALNTLLEGCHDKCMMCDLDAMGRKKCPLRRALDSIPNDVPERHDGDCQYYTVI